MTKKKRIMQGKKINLNLEAQKINVKRTKCRQRNNVCKAKGKK